MSSITSNTYLFGQNTKLDDLFTEAYERIGIIGNKQTPLNVQSAIMSANLELSSWPGRGLNLWLIQRQMLNIYPNQSIYPLPVNTVRILEVVATQPTRLMGGTASSSAGGTPNNCFNPSISTGCTQDAPNGNIAYDYGENTFNSIFYVGITPLAQAIYTLVVEYSFDNINWITIFNSPKQTYFSNQTAWFVIENTVSARSWRIRETGGNILAIQQIYFSQPSSTGVGDRTLGAISRSVYMSIASKMNSGDTSSYYFNETITPSIVLYPVPSVQTNFTNILYSNYCYAQDVTQMFQTVDVPQRFYDALVAGLAARLALKFAPEKFSTLKAEAQEAYVLAANTDFENVSLRFNPDFSVYGE